MICPLCDCPFWSSIEKDERGINLWVQCGKCRIIYRTRFAGETIEYRGADGIASGRIMQEIKVPDDDAELEKEEITYFKLIVRR